MSIRLQDIATSSALDLTNKVLVTDGSTEYLATLGSLLEQMHPVMKASRTATQTITAGGNMYKYALTAVDFQQGSGMSISDGGVKVSEAGTYKVTANLYGSNSNAANSFGCYIYYGTSFTDAAPTATGATELVGTYTLSKSDTSHQVVGLAALSAGDILYLAGRANLTDCTAQYGWLMVERMA